MSRPLQATSLGPRDLAVALVINLMWGFNIVASKMAVEATGPFTAAALRQVMVALVCITALRIVPGRMRALLALGLVSGGAFLFLINLSLMMSTNIAALAIAGQLGVPFALILGIVLLKERIHRVRMIGIGLAFSGVLLVVFDPGARDELLGLGLSVLAALCWAIGSLLQRQLRGVPVLTIYAWIGVIGLLATTPAALLFEPDAVARLPELPLREFGWVAFSGIGSTVIGQGGMAWLLQRHPLSTVVPLTLASPVLGVIGSSWFFQTPITPIMMAGGIIAMTGVTIIILRSTGTAETGR